MSESASEARLAAQSSADVAPGLAKQSTEFGRSVGAAVFAASMNDGKHEAYNNSFPAYTPPQGPGLWEPTALTGERRNHEPYR